jgi:hypothetical protein
VPGQPPEEDEEELEDDEEEVTITAEVRQWPSGWQW